MSIKKTPAQSSWPMVLINVRELSYVQNCPDLSSSMSFPNRNYPSIQSSSFMESIGNCQLSKHLVITINPLVPTKNDNNYKTTKKIDNKYQSYFSY